MESAQFFDIYWGSRVGSAISGVLKTLNVFFKVTMLLVISCRSE